MFKYSKNGFSMIELMVVISIISVVSAIGFGALPAIQIRAGRAEMYANLNAIFALNASYRAENSINGPDFSYGVQEGTPLCDPNDLGFQATNCANLRYVYYFSGDGGLGIPFDATRTTNFVVSAGYQHEQEDDGGSSTGSGNPPTRLCKSRVGYDFRIADWWTMSPDRVIQPVQNSPIWDAMREGCSYCVMEK